MTYDANTLNGFRQTPSKHSDIRNDNQFFLHGTADLNGTVISAVKLANTIAANDVSVYSTNGAIATSGKAAIIGGTGLVMTLAAPQEGCFVDILLQSITSGAVTVTTPAGVTFDGTNNTATFDAAADRLSIGYKTSTQWQIFDNVSVVLSSV